MTIMVPIPRRRRSFQGIQFPSYETDDQHAEGMIAMTNKPTFNVDLDDVGRQWVYQCLKESVCLGSILLPRLDLTEGKTAVLGAHGELPCDDVERLWASVAHLDVLDEKDRAGALLELLKSLEAAVGGVDVVVEDYLRLPKDGHTRALLSTGSVVVAGGTVFHIRGTSSLNTPAEVVELFGGGFEWPLNAFILQAEATHHFVEWVERNEARQLANALVGTIHAVYDAEGYIAWIRSKDIANQIL